MTVLAERPATDLRTLLDPDVWALLVEDVRTTHPDMTPDLANRGVAQMAAFLAAGTQTDEPLAPSKLVDAFWHAFLLRTQPYAEFCQKVAGRFIHHVPDESGQAQDPAAKAVARQRTLDAITAAGYTVDPELWPDAADCNQCYAGCSDSPNSGKKSSK